ncbi:MAG: hypothetical protein ACOY0T_07520 [Myxococcota bacterium]
MRLRIALKLLLSSGLLACAATANPRAPLTQPASTSHLDSTRVERVAPTPPWFERTQSFPRVQSDVVLSQHLDGSHFAEIVINPEAEATYRQVATDSRFDVGTLIVERLRAKTAATPNVILALERRADAWVYWELDGNGRGRELNADSACHGCHAGARAAPVFGPLAVDARESNTEARRSPK